MKNIEKYLDTLLENTDAFECTTCKLRLGYDPCESGINGAKEFCDPNVELNKKWLKAEYIPEDVNNILKALHPTIRYIYKDEHDVVVSNLPYNPNRMPCPGERTYWLTPMFDYSLFLSLPLDTTLLISDVISRTFLMED